MQRAGVTSLTASNSNNALQQGLHSGFSPAGAANGGQQLASAPGRAVINNLVKPSRMPAELDATDGEGDRKRQKSAVPNSAETNPGGSLFMMASGKPVPLSSNSISKAMNMFGEDGGQQAIQCRQDQPFTAPRAVQDQCIRGSEGAGSAGGSAFRPAFPVGNERDFAGGAAIAEVNEVTEMSVDEWGFEVDGFWDSVDLVAIDALVEKARAANAGIKSGGSSSQGTGVSSREIADVSAAAGQDRGKAIAAGPSESRDDWSEGALFKAPSGRVLPLSSTLSKIANIFFGDDEGSSSSSGLEKPAVSSRRQGSDRAGRGKAISEVTYMSADPRTESSCMANLPQSVPQHSFGTFGVEGGSYKPPSMVQKNSGPTFRPPGQQPTAFKAPRPAKH